MGNCEGKIDLESVKSGMEKKDEGLIVGILCFIFLFIGVAGGYFWHYMAVGGG